MLTKLVFFVISILIYANEGYKILVVFPFPGMSHGILGNGYVEHLLNAGHEVTYITPFPSKNPRPNLRQIEVVYSEDMRPKGILSIESILNKEADPTDIRMMLFMTHKISDYFLNSEPVKKFINDPKETFDVVIVEWLFTEIFVGFAAVFQCPLILSSSVDPHWMILKLIDEISNPAYVPDVLSNNIPPYTFLQRAHGLWKQITVTFFKIFLQSSCDTLYEKVFISAAKKRGITIPSLEEASHNASFVLSNSHISLGEPVRLPQNMKPVAGYHILSKPEPLPEDLRKLMDNANNGVIFFSMGSSLKSKDMPNKMKREFLEIFGELNQTVLWKFEENLSDVPKNIHFLQWAPQQSILAHPNCLLFVTHGGLLSTTEAVHFGVPMIAIPVFGDQFINVDRAVSRNIAKKVDLSYDTPKQLKVAIQEVLNDPKYRERIEYLSLIYHDRPVSPGKELVHWVEHTIKTGGAPHFRSRALQLSWYQKMYLDLAAVILTIIIALCSTLKYLLKSARQINYEKKRN